MEDRTNVHGRKEIRKDIPARIPPAVAWRYTRRQVVSAALATAVLHPIDTIKVRMQCSRGSGLRMISNMLKNEGTGGFYKGLSAGLLRQAAFTTVNLTSYRILFASTASSVDNKLHYSPSQRWWCSRTAEAISAFVCCPADLVLTRMQADVTLPAALRRNYRNVFHAFYRVVNDEGVLALWKGAGPTVLRTAGLGIGLTASEKCLGFFDHHFSVSRDANILAGVCIVGFLLPVCSNPFDFVKTQLQMMQPDANGRYPFTGPLDCAIKTLKFGGPLKFYTGFAANCLYLFPHSTLTFIISKRRQGQQRRF